MLDLEVRHMEAMLKQVSSEFQAGRMQAFGTRTASIFKSFDQIRDMQQSLANAFVEVEKQMGEAS